jgi:hypothetical protein
MQLLNVFIVLFTILILLAMGVVLLISYVTAKMKLSKKPNRQEESNRYIEAHELLLKTMEMTGDTSTSGYSRDI